MNRVSGRQQMSRNAAVLALLMFCLILLCSCSGRSETSGGNNQEGNAGQFSSLESEIKSISEYYLDPEADPDPMDGETPWRVFTAGCCSQDPARDDYSQAYYDNLRGYLKSHDGSLDEERYTSYETAALAVTSLGRDPTDVEGYDLMKKVDDYKNISYQGVNAEIYALITAGFSGYKLKSEKKYIEDILDSQQKDGGMAIYGDEGDVDVTAMAVQALAPYISSDSEDKNVRKAVDSSMEHLGASLDPETGYGSSESTAQVIMALCSMGEDPAEAEAFKVGDKDLEEELMGYRTEEGFCHQKGDETNEMATRQGLLALCALRDLREGKEGIFSQRK